MYHYKINQVERTAEEISSTKELMSMQMSADHLQLGVTVNDYAGFTSYVDNIIVFCLANGDYIIVREKGTRRIPVKSGKFEDKTQVEAYIQEKLGW